jgi:hypothetical protein
MPLFPREERDIITDSIQLMSQNTNITQLSPGGKARFFISTVAREQAKQQQLFDQNMLQAFIKFSNGKMLDFFGDMFKNPRLEASHAEATNNNFMFYVQSGKFGDINAGSMFTIPSGTSVYTKEFEGTLVTPGLETSPVIVYNTISPAVCNPDSSYAYAAVRAVVEGSESSVPKNALVQHGFDTYALSGQNLLKCTNRFSIDNGINRENDQSYRFRLGNMFTAKSQAIEAAIRLAALSVTGVRDVSIINHEQGPGTFSLYVLGFAPTTSPQLVTAVSQSVSQVTSCGNRSFVLAPSALGIELSVAVGWSSRATAQEIAQGYSAMRVATERYINELDLGESLDLNLLIDVMLAAAPKASYIGRTKPNTFEEVYVYRSSASGGTVRSIALGTTIDPLYNQRISLETSTKYRGLQFSTI